MEPVPLPPIVEEVSEAELAALQRCQGGHSTHDGTEEHELFKRLDARGFVKIVGWHRDDWTAWKLSGFGLKLACPDDADFELVGKDHPLPG